MSAHIIPVIMVEVPEEGSEGIDGNVAIHNPILNINGLHTHITPDTNAEIYLAI